MTALGPQLFEAEVQDLARHLSGGHVVSLTGAGVSTASGIPDYRDEEGRWKQRQPMQFREFTGTESARRRYWARSMVGWERMARAEPNAAHHALHALEKRGVLRLLITQNVDGLHSAAGSQQVVDLHGRLDRVVCLGCRDVSARAELQARLLERNPSFVGRSGVDRADGDVELEHTDYEAFELVPCQRCGGVLKPDVVFFGENVPAPRVSQAMDSLSDARALLIVGSSLMVFSGFRFARAAARLGIPVIVVNRGKTRADDLASLKVEGGVGDVLARVVAAL